MRFKIGIMVLAFMLLQVGGFAQGDGGFFYDTLTIMDYNTNEESEMLSRLYKPITRNFYLKTDDVSYSLFKNEVANLNPEQIADILTNGFSLYIDKREHQGHKNLIPSTLEVLDENNSVLEAIELKSIKNEVLEQKLTKDAFIRLSGFVISVNERKFGPIIMNVKVVE